ncbi:hypothetical protein DC438_05210 [Cronobacter sakazakii]|uniref:DUF551 domain-containing protein n=1 Tax=Enterobacteriaceae TaxID=543 RepID=UPI000F7BFFD4|nr:MULTISPECIES: DUF551 domain-containing protein [Enterobacteriaceae]AZP32560.1 hypothetical protein DC438_05210 [Cronobacter sakazakii]QBF86528.1 DUF551 domain-containing protein [Leclercia adecarboxylata]
MTKFTNKQLTDQAREEVDFWRERDELIPSQQTAIRLRLAEIALAALMAPTEPVYQYRIRNACNGQVTEWQTIRRDQVDFVLKAQPLNAEFQITAPPVPVVPEEATPGSIEILASIRPPHGVAYQWDEEQRHAAADAWNACRGAMLQGADGNSPVILDGYVLVPIIPTEEMIINGFEAELREEFRDPEALETYEKMSGCELAAHRTKLCWAAMIAAAPQQERRI